MSRLQRWILAETLDASQLYGGEFRARLYAGEIKARYFGRPLKPERASHADAWRRHTGHAFMGPDPALNVSISRSISRLVERNLVHKLTGAVARWSAITLTMKGIMVARELRKGKTVERVRKRHAS